MFFAFFYLIFSKYTKCGGVLSLWHKAFKTLGRFLAALGYNDLETLLFLRYQSPCIKNANHAKDLAAWSAIAPWHPVGTTAAGFLAGPAVATDGYWVPPRNSKGPTLAEWWQMSNAPSTDINWHALYDEYLAFGGLLTVFCTHKKISHTLATKIFAAMDEETLARDKRAILRELVNAGIPAVKNTRAKIDSQDEAISLAASRDILKALALNPKTEPVALTDNRVQVNFFLPENGRAVRGPDAKVVDSTPRLEGGNGD